MRRNLALAAALVLAAAALFADEGRPLLPQDFVAFASVGSPRISPDGTRAVYVQATVDLSSSVYRRTIWMADLEGGGVRQFTSSPGNDFSPRWSPDGGSVAFISTRSYRTAAGEEGHGRQLWLISADGGEARLLTELEEGVSDFRWSPNGSRIYLLSRESRSEDEERARSERHRRLDDAVVVDAELFRDQFWTVDLRSGEVIRLCEGHAGIDGFEVSPDGSRIVYCTNYTGRMDDDLKFDLWLVDTASGEMTRLTDLPGPETSPVWSPDGRRVAYVSTTEAEIEYARTDVTIIDAEPGVSPVVLAAGFDRSVVDLAWAGDGYIYCTFAVGVATPLYRLQPRPDAEPELVDTGGLNIRDFTLDRGPGRALLLAEGYPRLPDVHLLDLESGALRPVTEMTAQLEPFELGGQRLIAWECDGWEIEGLLVTPPGYREGERVPLVLYCHGGPYGRTRDALYGEWQVYAAAGYAVIAPNFRGGYGYGDAFGKALRNDIGGADYRDCIAGVDAVVEMGIADPERLAVTGGSWGGYLTNWIISQTPRFAAAVSRFGLFSLLTDMSNSIQPGFERMYFGVWYWEDMTPYLERAPQTYAQNITTPVLILHGEEDTLTNISNSREMYTALRLLGRTVQFVVYPREGHGFREPNHRIDSLRRTIEWFDRYCKGEGTSPGP